MRTRIVSPNAPTFYGTNNTSKLEYRNNYTLNEVSRPLYPPPVNKCDLDIYPGDALFEFVADRDSDKAALESSLNGILVPNYPEDFNNRQKLNYMYSNIVFRGFAVNMVKYQGNITGVPVAQIGDLATVINTGLLKISVGDLVAWKLPDLDRIDVMCFNRSPNFRTLELVPFHSLDLNEVYYNRELIMQIIQYYNVQFPLQRDQFLNMNNDVNLRKFIMTLAGTMAGNIVGVAQSTAEPGKPFDILISPVAKRQVLSSTLFQ